MGCAARAGELGLAAWPTGVAVDPPSPESHEESEEESPLTAPESALETAGAVDAAKYPE